MLPTCASALSAVVLMRLTSLCDVVFRPHHLLLHCGGNRLNPGFGLIKQALGLAFCDLSEAFKRFGCLSAELLDDLLPLLRCGSSLSSDQFPEVAAESRHGFAGSA